MAALAFVSRVRALKQLPSYSKFVSESRTINDTKEEVVVMMSLGVDFC